jgi:Uma2 family endonuclease
VLVGEKTVARMQGISLWPYADGIMWSIKHKERRMEAPALIVAPQRIDYPERDGKPVGETDVHRDELLGLVSALDEHFRADPQVYVSGNLMFYYEEGLPSSVVSPDVFVVRGVAKGRRRIYKLWEEQVPPALVIELSSRSTRLEDSGNKKALYAMLGVQEYYLFDPLEEYLRPPLQGFRLERGEYLRLEPAADGALFSAALGLWLRREGSHLALFDAETNARLLSPPEQQAARLAAEQQAAEALAQASALATEVERLRAEIERLRGGG